MKILQNRKIWKKGGRLFNVKSLLTKNVLTSTEGRASLVNQRRWWQGWQRQRGQRLR